MSAHAASEALFVYGDLMRKGRQADLMSRGDVRFRGPARCRGLLYDLGDQPGLVAGGRAWVSGELYRLEDAAGLLRLLDGLRGKGTFARRITEIRWKHGPGTAWAYHYVGPLGGLEAIPGGSWRAHLKARRRSGPPGGEE